LSGIRALLGLAEAHRRSCEKVRVIASDHLQDVRTKIADLVRLEAILAGTVERCRDTAMAVLALFEAAA
jgi:MerR family mercuric resistance operon transcriptional regulator